ncbi:MAG: hypothetical protein ABSB24_08205 [Gaiellaceae bacterium]
MAASVLLRFAAGLAALVAGVAAVAVAAVLLERTPGPAPAAVSAAVPTAPARAAPAAPRAPAGFPAPPAGAVVFSREDGGYALALGVVPQGSHVVAQASLLGPLGAPVRGVSVSFTVQSATRNGAACGSGCYRATLPVTGRPSAVVVDVQGRGATTRWRVSLPAAWPPVNASVLVARAGRVWRSLRSLAFVETLASDPAHAVSSSWRLAAPDRAAYHVTGGYESVIIGRRRWDKAPGGRWVESPQSIPIRQPQPFWVSATNAYLLGSGEIRGRRVWRVSFFDPATPAWFEVELDKQTLRTLDLRMTTTAHFMHDVYGPFDAPAGITPPS